MKQTAMSISQSNKLRYLCYLFILFLVGCFTGWIYEEIFYWVAEGMLRNRGVLYGPWLPIYGIGALIIYPLKPMKKNPVILFALCVFLTGLVEYIIGYIGIHVFDLRLWDYRGLFLNIDGIVCFRSVVCFGVMGLLFHYLLEPVIEKAVNKVKPNTVYIVCAFLLLLFAVDCVLSALFRTPITY